MSNEHTPRVNYYNNSWAFVTIPTGTELRTGHVHRTPSGANLVGPLGEWQATGGSTNVEQFMGKHQRPYVCEPQWDHWMLDEVETRNERERLFSADRFLDWDKTPCRPTQWGEEADFAIQESPNGRQYYPKFDNQGNRIRYSWADQLVPNSIHKRFWVRLSQEELHPDPARELWELVKMAARKEGEHE